MTEHPIIFAGPMVRAILDRTKTQDRRVVEPQPDPESWPAQIECEWYSPTVIRKGEEAPGPWVFGFASEDEGWKCPYGAPGDRLWVRETFGAVPLRKRSEPVLLGDDIVYKASEELLADEDKYIGLYRPSTHMPRWASRIALEVTAVRAERLQDITDADCFSEGIETVAKSSMQMGDGTARGLYRDSWDSINAKRGFAFDSNPRVWVIDFERMQE